MSQSKNYQVGSRITEFEAESSSGKSVGLSSLKGKWTVVYFYPKDSTPGCTLQGQQFQKLLPKYKALGAQVFGVSRDSIASHCKFIDKQGFKFELLSDEDEHLCNLFDVIHMKNMYGKKILGVVRSTFLISPKLEIVQEWRKVKSDGHAGEVLESLKSLSAKE